MADAPAQAGTITVAQAEKLVDLTAERLRQLARAGHIPKAVKGRYPLVGLVTGYIRFLRDENRAGTKTQAEGRVRDARAREIELRIAERQNRVIDLEEHDSVVDEVVGIFIAEMSALPARVTKDLPLRRNIETEIDQTRRKIVARAEQRSAELQARGGTVATDAEDDA